MAIEQLLLWEKTEEEKIREDFEKLKTMCDKMRKSQFAKIGELKKQMDDFQWQLDEMKHMFYVLEKCFE